MRPEGDRTEQSGWLERSEVRGLPLFSLIPNVASYSGVISAPADELTVSCPHEIRGRVQSGERA
jgi:hypothetical protein